VSSHCNLRSFCFLSSILWLELLTTHPSPCRDGFFLESLSSPCWRPGWLASARRERPWLLRDMASKIEFLVGVFNALFISKTFSSLVLISFWISIWVPERLSQWWRGARDATTTAMKPGKVPDSRMGALCFFLTSHCWLFFSWTFFIQDLFVILGARNLYSWRVSSFNPLLVAYSYWYYFFFVFRSFLQARFGSLYCLTSNRNKSSTGDIAITLNWFFCCC